MALPPVQPSPWNIPDTLILLEEALVEARNQRHMSLINRIIVRHQKLSAVYARECGEL